MGRRHRNKLKRLIRVAKKPKEVKMISKLVIEEDVFHKIMHWVNKAEGEVSGLGSIQIRDGIPHVIDAVLIEQECASTETELNAQSVCKAMTEHDDLNKPGDLRWWWHSHVNMGVFWSGTDNQTIKDLGSNGWILATVFNKKQEMRSAFYSVKPFSIFLDDIKTEIVYPLADSLRQSWDQEFTRKVKENKYTAYTAGKDWKEKDPYQGPQRSWVDDDYNYMGKGVWQRDRVEPLSKLHEADLAAMDKAEKEIKESYIEKLRALSVPEDEIEEMMECFGEDHIKQLITNLEVGGQYGTY